MIPTVIGAMLTKTLVNKLIPRIGYRRILIGNTLALGAMIASFYFIDNQVPHGVLLVWLAVFGAINSPAIFRHEHPDPAGSQQRARQQRQRSAVGGDAALHEPGVAIAASLLGLFSIGQPEGVAAGWRGSTSPICASA